MFVNIKALKDCFEKVKPAASIGLMGLQSMVRMKICQSVPYLRLEGYGGDLFIRAYFSFETTPEVEIEECLPTVQLEKILACLPSDGELKLNFPEKQPCVEVEFESSSWRVPFLGKGAFADFPDCQDWAIFDFSPELAAGIEFTLHAASQDWKKQNFCGVRLDNEHPDKPCLVATDTHRLALCEEREPIGGEKPCCSFTIPTVLCKYVLKYPVLSTFRIEQLEDDAPKAILFSGDGMEVYSSLIPGDYPEWRRIVPEEGGRPDVMLEAEKLLKVLPAVDAIEGNVKERPAIRLSIDGAGNIMEIYARTETSSAQTNLMCEPCPGWSAGGYGLTAWANRKYIKEMAQAVKNGPIRFVYRDGQTPLVFKYLNKTEIIMPMKIDEVAA